MHTLAPRAVVILLITFSAAAQSLPVGISVAPERVLLDRGEEVRFTATATLADGSLIDVSERVTWSSSSASAANIDATGRATATAQGTAVITATLALLQDTAVVEVAAPGPFAPDPAGLAPPFSSVELTSFSDATSFLYTGPTPVQTGVAPGTIIAMRAGVIRGIVRGRTGAPLGGVRVSILDHTQYGSTYSRTDGAYDLAVNAGGTYSLVFERRGYLPVQRQVPTRWQEYVICEDVVMTRYDNAATHITLPANGSQVARATAITDSSGHRRATMIFPPSTTATMTLADGSTQQLAQMTLRLTEYTVGANGVAAMPAPLPPESAYTYCIELSADEATAAGATVVTLSKRVAFYVENFIGFPVGGAVPAGYYDRVRAAWIASENGHVIKIVSETAFMADLDTTGDGVPDSPTTLAQLGIDEEERRQLAAVYEPGASLWRVPVTHFTPYDLNWPGANWYAVEPGSDLNPAAPTDGPEAPEHEDDPAECAGSIVRCDNQTLGEEIALTGSSFRLVYDSGRVHGRSAERQIRLRVNGPTTPRSVTRIVVRVIIAGTVTERTFVPGAEETTLFSWDGRDAYGRVVTGAADAHVTVSYTYPAVYMTVTPEGRAFGQRSGMRFPSRIAARAETIISTSWRVPLSGLRAESVRLGGWMLSSHHLYDYSRRSLVMGGGRQRTADGRDAAKYEYKRIAGLMQCCDDGSGVATRSSLGAMGRPAVGPDGSIYINEEVQIRHITPDGRINRIAGTGTHGYSGDGGPAHLAQISAFPSIVIGADGSLYFPDAHNHRVRRIKNGVITTVAGNGTPTSFTADENMPATQARVSPRDLDVGPDGAIYVFDGGGFIRQITPDGAIRTVAGGGTRNEDGVPARDFAFGTNSNRVALGPDGSLYFVEDSRRIRRVGADGTISTVVRGGVQCDVSGLPPVADGAAIDACLGVESLSVGPDGSIYVADGLVARVRVITPDGEIRVIAGSDKGDAWNRGDSGFANERISQPVGAVAGPDGAVYFAERFIGGKIWRVAPIVERYVDTSSYVPSSDGQELYAFSGSRHVRTLDALTGAVLLEFGYDSQRRLSTVTDADGNVTSIERTTAGDLSAIIAPGGHAPKSSSTRMATCER